MNADHFTLHIAQFKSSTCNCVCPSLPWHYREPGVRHEGCKTHALYRHSISRPLRFISWPELVILLDICFLRHPANPVLCKLAELVYPIVINAQTDVRVLVLPDSRLFPMLWILAALVQSVSLCHGIEVHAWTGVRSVLLFSNFN